MQRAGAVDILASCQENSVFHKAMENAFSSESATCPPKIPYKVDELEKDWSAIGSALFSNNKTPELNKSNQYKSDLQAKEDLFSKISKNKLLHLKETVSHLKMLREKQTPKEISQRINISINKINEFCKGENNKRREIPDLVDPGRIRNIIDRSGSRSPQPAGQHPRDAIKEVHNAINQFDADTTPAIEMKLASLMSTKEMAILLGSKSFLARTNILDQNQSTKPLTLAAKCMRFSSNFMEPIDESVVTVGLQESTNNMDELLDEEIAVQNKLTNLNKNLDAKGVELSKLASKDFLKEKFLEEKIKDYIQYSPIGISEVNQTLDNSYEKAVLCDMVHQTLADEKLHDQINKSLRYAGLGAAVLAIPFSVGSSAYLVPYIVSASAMAELAISSRNIVKELEIKTKTLKSYPTGEASSITALDTKIESDHTLKNETVNAAINIALQAYYLKTVSALKGATSPRSVASIGKGNIPNTPNAIMDDLLIKEQAELLEPILKSLSDTERRLFTGQLSRLKDPFDVNEVIALIQKGAKAETAVAQVIKNQQTTYKNIFSDHGLLVATKNIEAPGAAGADIQILLIDSKNKTKPFVAAAQVERERLALSSASDQLTEVYLLTPNIVNPTPASTEVLIFSAISEAKKNGIQKIIIDDDIGGEIYNILNQNTSFGKLEPIVLRGSKRPYYVFETDGFSNNQINKFRSNHAQSVPVVENGPLRVKEIRELKSFSVKGKDIMYNENDIGDVVLQQVDDLNYHKYTTMSGEVIRETASDLTYVDLLYKNEYMSTDLWVATITEAAKNNPTKNLVSGAIKDMHPDIAHRWNLLSELGVATKVKLYDRSGVESTVYKLIVD